MSLTWRTASLEDLPAIARVYGEMADADHPDWAESAEEIHDDLVLSWVDLARDTVLVLDGERPVAFGQAMCSGQGETLVRSYLFGGVVPDYRDRGIGRELLARQLARAHEQLDAVTLDLPLWIIGDGKGPGQARLFEHVGMPATRWFRKMERDLAEPIPELAPPDGLAFAAFTEDRWDDALEMRNAAFRDHWGSQPILREAWLQIVEGSSMRPDLSSLVVEPDGRIVGLLTTLVIPEDFERQGYTSAYIQSIAVLRECGVAASHRR